MPRNQSLIIAGWLSMAAAFAHLVCILGGPDWYLAMGAGRKIAQMVQDGLWYPTLITLAISALLVSWGLYAWSGAGLIRPLPCLNIALVVISLVYIVRGLGGFILPLVVDSPMVQQNSLTFWWISSSICCLYGYVYAIGTYRCWQQHGKPSAKPSAPPTAQ